MLGADLVDSPARTQAAAIRDRLLSASELLELVLARVAERNPRINAIVTLAEESARAAARGADRALAAGAPVGPLHGVPFVVKDLIATAGIRTTAGSRLLAGFVPRHGAPAIDRLIAAGCVLVGKTNCPEFALDIHTTNRLFGPTRNPLDERFTPGGSSGGDSAALAAGFAGFAVGTDYGGSIRWPAQCCGVASLRPTPGVVPATGQLPFAGDGELPAPNSMSLLQRSTMPAPMARSVADLWEILGTMAGPDRRDAQAIAVELRSPEQVDPRRLRCAWFASEGTYPVRADVRAAVEAGARALEQAGLAVAELRPPGWERGESIYGPFRAADGLPDHRVLAAGREHELTESIREWLAATPDVPVKEYRRLAGDRDQLRASVLEFMETWPILLTAVSCLPGFRADDAQLSVDGQPIPRFGILAPCRVVTLLGLPAAVVCCGTSDDGLPVAVQVVARPFREREAIAVALELERHFGGWRART